MALLPFDGRDDTRSGAPRTSGRAPSRTRTRRRAPKRPSKPSSPSSRRRGRSTGTPTRRSPRRSPISRRASTAPPGWTATTCARARLPTGSSMRRRRRSKKLGEIKKPSPTLAASISDWINSLVAADRTLATTAISEGGSPKALTTASRELAKGHDIPVRSSHRRGLYPPDAECVPVVARRSGFATHWGARPDRNARWSELDVHGFGLGPRARAAAPAGVPDALRRYQPTTMATRSET
jgi:hypothetical protein